MIASSCFAIPVSCTGAMFAGAHCLSRANIVYFSEKETPKENFYVLASDKQSVLDYFAYDKPDSVSRYLQNYPKRQFILNQNSGEIEADASLQNRIRFTVLERGSDTQTLELRYSQEAGLDTVVKYKATAKSITPISQWTYSRSLLFEAFPYALAFAILFSIMGKVILSLVNRKSPCVLSSCGK